MTPRIFRPGGRSRHSRVLMLLAIPALTASVLSAAPGSEPATASPAAPPASPDDASTSVDFASLPADAEPVAVTLITGDTVLWSDNGDGQPRVEIEQAPREVPVEFEQHGTQEDFYVIPSDVMPHVVAGTVDDELFNIPSLIRQGLDDESTGGELPVIVTFDEDAEARQLERDANALPAASAAQGIEGVQGAGVKIDRGRAGKFRDAVLAQPGKGKGRGPSVSSSSDSLTGAVDTIMLDQMLEIDLAESVPQIGAPEAWEAGYTGEGVTVAVLDTGIDANHPDLVGQVVAEQNFTDEPDATDTQGHGTHVAATVAGTGAASDGARRGVAPGADLLNGKVCVPTPDGQGVCQTSWIMAGMEWAAGRADVVNMSLSGPVTDGTDPLSQLVNELSAETGTLFVTSAGNSGGAQTVGTPAAADAALAVGAVDKSDQLASFSSRGPRVVDHAVKPEITAPGVGIVAARAGGTSLGNPIDENYTSLSGTSMASPHVAGAAALLAQAKPALEWAELKDALVSTATAVDGTFGGLWWEVGVGRVDVASAVDSPVYAQGTVNLGHVTDQAEQDLTYTNHGDADIVLDLHAAVTGTSGEPLDVVSLSADTVTVPAGGQASVTVAIDITGVPDRENLIGGGIVTATADGMDLRTAIGFGPVSHTLTIEVLDSNGDPIGSERAPDRFVNVIRDAAPVNLDGVNPLTVRTSDGMATIQLPTGSYTIVTGLSEREPGTGRVVKSSGLVELEIVVDGNKTITLDARDAVAVEQPKVPRAVHKRNHEVLLYRQGEDPAGRSGWSINLGGRGNPVYVTPTSPGELGFMAMEVYWLLAEPQTVRPNPGLSGNDPDTCRRQPSWCHSPTSAYAYTIAFLYENGIPHDLREKVTRGELVEIPTRYHTHYPDALIGREFGAIGPLSGAAAFGAQAHRMWIEPGEVTEYVLADDRFWYNRGITEADAEFVGSGARQSYSHRASFDFFPTAEAGTRRAEERWHEGPLRVGAPELREEFFEIRPEPPRHATASRGGSDGNQFIPGYKNMDNTRGHFTFGGVFSFLPAFASWRMWNIDSGAELQGLEFDPGLPGVPLFTLAAGEATYRLEQIDQYPVEGEGVGERFQTGPATTTWEFASRPSDAEAFPYRCPHRVVDQSIYACQIQPLIQLEYKLGLDIHNQAPAGRAHVFTILAGHHSEAIERAKVTELSVQASFDDGQTWTDARVVGKAKDTREAGGFRPSAEPYQQYRVVVKIPPLHRTNGYVSLRVTAEDANGGTVEQTAHRAHLLKD